MKQTKVTEWIISGNPEQYNVVDAFHKMCIRDRIHGITKNDVDSYIREFPIAIFKYYYELRLDDVFA